MVAFGKSYIFDTNTKRPIGAILLINKNLNNKRNSQNYLESIILHQLTHILGFSYAIFDQFEGVINNVIKDGTETRINKAKKFTITSKVISYTKKYFNCDTITGVELEDLVMMYMVNV